MVDQLQIRRLTLGGIGTLLDLLLQLGQLGQLHALAVQGELPQLGQLAALELVVQKAEGLFADCVRVVGIPDRLSQGQQLGAVHGLIAGDQPVHRLALQGPAAAIDGGAQGCACFLVHREGAHRRVQVFDGFRGGRLDPLHPGRLVHGLGSGRGGFRNRSGFRFRRGQYGFRLHGDFRRLRGGSSRSSSGGTAGLRQLLQTGNQRRNAGVLQGQAELERRNLPIAHPAGQILGQSGSGQAVLSGAEPQIEIGELRLFPLAELSALGGQQEEAGRFGTDRENLGAEPAEIMQPAGQSGHDGAQRRGLLRPGQDEDRILAVLSGVGRGFAEQIHLRRVVRTLCVHQDQAQVFGEGKILGQNLKQSGLSRSGKRIDRCGQRWLHGNTSFTI